MEIPRLYTLDEANALLPRVRPLVEKLVAHKAEVDQNRHEFEALEASKASGNGYDLKRETLARRITELMKDVRVALQELYELAIQVKDMDIGLVDFPARRATGEVVNLCWKLGEESIMYWHPLNSNFAGRKPLSEF